jgi:hypothetical protein
MISLRLTGLAVLATLTALGAADNPSIGVTLPVGGALPPVLRPDEPADSRIFTLPGLPKPAPVIQRVNPVAPILPIAKASPTPSKLIFAPPPALPDVTVSTAPAKPVLPSEMEREVAFYFQQHIGHWKEADVAKLLGEPIRSRSAFDETKVVSGRIQAFHDPTGRYRELELDFDRQTGTLRTVFVYPPHLTWQECRRRWSGEISAADAREGRTFYSFVKRRLDVLVDANGRVISLGLY